MIGRTDDFGAYFAPAIIGAGTAVAAGTGDATKVTGETVDCDGFHSGSVVLAYKATLADTKTVSFAVELQESEDASTWTTAEVVQAATVADTGSTGGTTELGTVKLDIKLASRKRYLRFNVTPDLSATATDTLTWSGVFIKGGARVLPAS